MTSIMLCSSFVNRSALNRLFRCFFWIRFFKYSLAISLLCSSPSSVNRDDLCESDSLFVSSLSRYSWARIINELSDLRAGSASISFSSPFFRECVLLKNSLDVSSCPSSSLSSPSPLSKLDISWMSSSGSSWTHSSITSLARSNIFYF